MYSKRHIASRPPPNASAHLEHTYSIVVPTFWKSSLPSVFTSQDTKFGGCCCQVTPRGKAAYKNITVCPQWPHSHDLSPYNLWLFSTIKMMMKFECFDLIQDSRGGTAVQLRWKICRAASGSGENEGVPVPKAQQASWGRFTAMCLLQKYTKIFFCNKFTLFTSHLLRLRMY